MFVPRFRARTTDLGSFDYHDLIDGMWAVLVFLNEPFDPVATTELGHLCKLREEFERRNARLMCVLPSDVENWLEQVEELEQCRVNVPVIVDDDDATIAKAMKVRRDTTAYFVVDIDKRVTLAVRSNKRTGRNFYELIRSLDAIQLAFFHQVSTPTNWSCGQDLLVPSHHTDRSAQALFPNGISHHPILKYRTTPHITRAPQSNPTR